MKRQGRIELSKGTVGRNLMLERLDLERRLARVLPHAETMPKQKVFEICFTILTQLQADGLIQPEQKQVLLFLNKMARIFKLTDAELLEFVEYFEQRAEKQMALIAGFFNLPG